MYLALPTAYPNRLSNPGCRFSNIATTDRKTRERTGSVVINDRAFLWTQRGVFLKPPGTPSMISTTEGRLASIRLCDAAQPHRPSA
jgi:hypothetical protein